MIVSWRSKLSGKSDAEVAKIKASKEFVNDHAAQLNEAEWTSPLLAGLLFLAAKSAPAPIASTLAVFGSVLYPVSRIHLGNAATPLGAVSRIAALGAIAFAIYKTV